MSAVKETLIFCDGSEGGVLGNDFTCPLDGPYGSGDTRSRSAKSQRASYGIDGWVYRNGKDYCPDCAKRLFPRAASTKARLP
jgi:hypothetical protein